MSTVKSNGSHVSSKSTSFTGPIRKQTLSEDWGYQMRASSTVRHAGARYLMRRYGVRALWYGAFPSDIFMYPSGLSCEKKMQVTCTVPGYVSGARIHRNKILWLTKYVA